MLFTQIPPPVKGWMCSYNFFPFSIGFIYFLSGLLLRLLWQSAFYLPSPFSLLPTHLSEHYYSSCPRCCRCRCTQFNFHPLLQCEGEGQVRGREDWGGGADRFKTASTLFFFPFLEGHYHRAWCSSAHHDVAWISFSASGSSGDEYILTRSDRHTWSKYTRTAARSAATKVRVCLQSEAGL